MNMIFSMKLRSENGKLTEGTMELTKGLVYDENAEEICLEIK